MRKGLVAVLVAMTACGVPIDAEPEAIGYEDQPAREQDGPAPEDLTAVSIYLVRDDALVHATRDLPTPTSPQAILASLFSGVTGPEERANLRTSIPPRSTILGLEREGSLLRLNLSRDFAGVGGEEETYAVAQVVLTATSIEGIELVAFQLEGVPTDVPVANGALSVEPVGAEDYVEILAP